MKQFCYNCGNKINNYDLFCSECGAKSEEKQVSVNENIVSDNKDVAKGANKKIGIILTNTERLAKKLGVDRASVVEVLESYVGVLEELKLKYKIVDVASRSKMNYWYEYQEVLLDVYKKELKSKSGVLPYLFIIGGNDIIPVPVINNVMVKEHDADIETDILYGYPYGIDTQMMLENTSLYKAEMLYIVARFPLSSDASFENFSDYLYRSSVAHQQGGIVMNEAYGQSDPHWQGVSKKVARGMIESGLFPTYENELSPKIYNGCLFILPELDETSGGQLFTDAGQVFNVDANLYYFNLHGGSEPDNSYYVGEVYKNDKRYSVAFPNSLITYAKYDNVFVTEACYGAKYIGYDKEHSMLHSALMSKTLLFLGSSRVAYGQIDTNQSSGHIELSLADLICSAFIDSLLSGCSAGEALLIARKMFFIKGETPYGYGSGNLSPYAAVTLAEFNLYGDPMLGLCSSSSSYKGKELPKTSATIAPAGVELGFEIEDITDKKQSILERVRSAVDANISEIVDKIGNQLYAEYGITPRKPKQILKVTYKNNCQEYNILYEEQNSKVIQKTVVTTDKNGNISSVYTSK